eukprot:scaffold55587_cov77-Phaeocystis_antarctica.AAC.1
MLDITNLRTQRTVVELQTHCKLSSGSRDQSRPSVVPESIATQKWCSLVPPSPYTCLCGHKRHTTVVWGGPGYISTLRGS